jgi:uncharacterized membrane protein YkvA (DUF1232 family)
MGIMSDFDVTTQVSGQEESVRRDFWRTARRAARHVPFMEDVVAAYYCALDKQTPLKTKGILLGALAYFVLPADAVPDFLFGLGFTDDIAVLTAAIGSVKSQMRPAHKAAAKQALQDA